MTVGGWIFLGISTVFVWGLAGWCYWQVIRKGAQIEQPPESLGG